MNRRALRFAAVAGAAFALTVPSQALGQAQIGDGSAASEYGDYVPTTSGHTSTTHHSSPTRSAPRHTYTPPVHRYYAPQPTHTYTPPVVHHSTPAYSAPAATAPRHHRHRRHHPAAAHPKHHAAAAHPKPVQQKLAVPSSPASSVDGGSHQLLWLGLAMIAMTVAVFARAGLTRKRYGSV